MTAGAISLQNSILPFSSVKNTTTRVTGASYRSPTTADYIQSFYSNLNEFNIEVSKGTKVDAITTCESFRRLVDNADLTIDLIMQELRQEPSPLVWVLDEASTEKPSWNRNIGDIQFITQDWAAWYEFRQSSGMKLTKRLEDYDSRPAFEYPKEERKGAARNPNMYRIVEILPAFLWFMVAVFVAYACWGLYHSLYSTVAVGIYGFTGFLMSAVASVWLKKEVRKASNINR